MRISYTVGKGYSFRVGISDNFFCFPSEMGSTLKRKNTLELGKNNFCIPSENDSTLNGKKLFPLRKHAYINVLKNSPPKNENFLIKKKSDIFHISA